MTTETILTDAQIAEMADDGVFLGTTKEISRAIEAAILHSPEIQALRKDAERLDWLADRENAVGNVQLQSACVLQNLGDMRAAIDAAMEIKP
uniref:hypothetical protein n=1 Tax=Castellaniella defragrans TaxID=75697 RepID=UPI003340C7CC